MFGETQQLIVVYKDELPLNLIKKMVETNDDEDGKIIGTEDGTIKIISWDEKMWLEQRKKGNIANKALFIDKVRGTENLKPLIDVKFSKWGIEYGWAGNQALLTVDTNKLMIKEDYNEFLEDFKKLCNMTGTGGVDSKTTKTLIGTGAALGIAGALLGPVGIIGSIVASGLFGGVYGSKADMKKQMLLYGVTQLYYKDLDDFMKS